MPFIQWLVSFLANDRKSMRRNKIPGLHIGNLRVESNSNLVRECILSAGSSECKVGNWSSSFDYRALFLEGYLQRLSHKEGLF